MCLNTKEILSYYTEDKPLGIHYMIFKEKKKGPRKVESML